VVFVVVVIADKLRYRGVATPEALNEETVVVEIKNQSEDYIVEGWLDVSALDVDDTLLVCEYVAVDGVNYRLFSGVQLSGKVPEPVIRFHGKTFVYDMMYKVVIIQTSGTLRSFPYRFTHEILSKVS
jgi:hypothetical protein